MPETIVATRNPVITPYLKTYKAFSLLNSIQLNTKSPLYAFYGYTDIPKEFYGISNISNTNPMVITSSNHGLASGDSIFLTNVNGMTELAPSYETSQTITVIDENSFSIPIDSSAYSVFNGGGTFYTNVQKTMDCSYRDMSHVYSNAIGMKRISGDCVSLVAPRYNWTRGTKYFPMYSDECPNASSPTYAMTDEGNLYFCLRNKNNSVSIVKPTHVSVDEVTSPDGFTWKYLTTIDLANNKFVTDSHIPVGFLETHNGTMQWDVSRFANNTGKLLSIDIVDGGEDYINGTYPIVINGDGTCAEAEAIIESGSVVTVNILNEGMNYSWINSYIDSSVVTIAATGRQAVLRANVEHTSPIGKNHIIDLLPTSVMVVWDFDSTENDTFMINNDYCLYGLMYQPLETKGNIACEDTYDLRTSLTLQTTPSGFVADEILTNGIYSSVVTEISGISSEIVKVANTGKNKYAIGETVSGSLGASNVITTVEESAIEYGSGAILYYEFLDAAIQRNNLQRERFNVVIDL